MQRGRRSEAANLTVVSFDGSPPRLKPPAGLSKEETALFAEIVTSCSPKHFTEGDRPLLVSYVQASLMAYSLAGDAATIEQWEKVVRAQMALATKLRLSPQSRTDPKLSHLRPEPQPSVYEMMRAHDERS